MRFFREENAPGFGGRLITTSSSVGLMPLACAGYYSASKYGESQSASRIWTPVSL